MKLEDLDIYNISMEIGDKVWFSVVEWENLAKYSIGQQIVKSADSIAANISEMERLGIKMNNYINSLETKTANSNNSRNYNK